MPKKPHPLKTRPQGTSLQTRPGVSVLIAITMVMAFMLTMSSVMSAMSRSFKIAKGGRSADQAYLNAITGLELGLYKQNKSDIAFNQLAKIIDTTYKDGKINLDPKNPNSNNLLTFKITDTITNGGAVCGDKDNEGEACKKTSYFTYPFAGTGSLGGNYCNPNTQPLVKDDLWYRDAYYFLTGKTFTGKSLIEISGGDEGPTGTSKSEWEDPQVAAYIDKQLEPLDHPCLWNTLEPGTSAEVPLYNNTSGDGSGSELIGDWFVRVRLPCEDGILCNTTAANTAKDASARMWLYTDPKKPTDKDARSMIWNMVATCTKNDTNEESTCFIQEKAKSANDGGTSSMITKSSLQNDTSNLTYKLTNGIKNVVIGKNNAQGKTIKATALDLTNTTSAILDFLTSKTTWEDYKVRKQTFHLSTDGNLQTTLENSAELISIPRVEYQIIYTNTDTSSKKPIFSNPTVISAGQNGGYTINLQSSLTKQTGNYSYAVVGK